MRAIAKRKFTGSVSAVPRTILGRTRTFCPRFEIRADNGRLDTSFGMSLFFTKVPMGSVEYSLGRCGKLLNISLDIE
jgi:hypothetical protein